MDYKVMITGDSAITKVQQVVQHIIRDVESGLLNTGHQMPSITSLSRSAGIARETVEKAYILLRQQGYLIPVPGKGNFVRDIKGEHLRILMIVNKLSSYKKEVYDALREKLGENASLDLQIHHYDPELFGAIVSRSLGKYDYFVVMPHFFSDATPDTYLKHFHSIPANRLLILDKYMEGFEGHAGIYQDFEMDIFDSFIQNKDVLAKYHYLQVIFPADAHHPVEILKGISDFANLMNQGFKVINDVRKLKYKSDHLYVFLKEADLGFAIKAIRKGKLVIGKDLGILSFNETIFKELLDITVVSTDFKGMGLKAAEMILAKKNKVVRNDFFFIRRGST
ncbi:MAG: GntR family transcriptional regulator [Chryseobacterium sp.]|nr:MAG: GntR family transcriptional regulator [Chryseobacterium sp.]